MAIFREMVTNADRPQPTFVGREPELEQLRAAYDAAADGEGGLVMVAGEPGIGKTALCQQLAIYAGTHDGRAIFGHCYEEASLPYLPFIESVHDFVLGREIEVLRGELGVGAAFVARVVPELRERLSIEPPLPGDPEQDRWRLLQAWTGFLRNVAAETPLVIVLEDLHWADHGTLDLMQHLARNLAGSRLLLVGTYRDVEVDRAHPLSSSLAEMRRATSFRRIVLSGLDLEEVHRLYEAVRGNEVPLVAAELVHRQTEGNPLFVHELLRFLVEEGYVVRRDDEYVYASDLPLESIVPEGLRDVVGKRLSRLSSVCNRMLSIASVIGREFRADLLQRVTMLSEAELVEALEEALRAGILDEAVQPGAISYRFVHALFRTTLYEEMSAVRRLQLHQIVGAAIEDAFEGRLEEHAAELAEHFSHSTDASDLAKAVGYGETAAQQATTVYAYGEAVRLLEAAIEAQDVIGPSDRVKRCDLLLALGAAQLPAGEARSVVEVSAGPAYELAMSLGDDVRASKACGLAIDALMRENQSYVTTLSEEYRGWVRRLTERAPRGSIFHAQALLATPFLHGFRSIEDTEQISAQFDEGIKLARELQDSKVLIAGAWHVINNRLSLRRWPAALQLAKELWDTPRDGIVPRDLAMFLQFAGGAMLLDGDRAAYDAAGEELSSLAERTHDGNVMLSARGNEALRLMLDGRLQEAFERAASAFGIAAEMRVYSLAPALAALQAGVYLGREAEVFNLDTRAMETPILPLTAAVFGETGPHLTAEAHEMLGAASVVVGLEKDVITQVLVLAMAVALKLRDQASAERLLGAFDGAVARFSASGLIFSLSRNAGDLAAMIGDSETARRHYAQAISDCELIRHRPEGALARLGLAELLLRHYPRERVEASQHIHLAIAELEAMRMRPALERALVLREGRTVTAKAPVYPDGLSGRQVEVLRMIAGGKTTREIAEALVLSERTVQRHIADIYAKIGARNRAEATAFALSRLRA